MTAVSCVVSYGDNDDIQVLHRSVICIKAPYGSLWNNVIIGTPVLDGELSI